MEKNYRTFKCKEKNIRVYTTELSLEQCRAIFLKVIEQAIKDCYVLYGTKRFDGNNTWLTAFDFIFDDEFLVDWGTILISPAEIMSMVGLDIHYMRQMVRAKLLDKVT